MQNSTLRPLRTHPQPVPLKKGPACTEITISRRRILSPPRRLQPEVLTPIKADETESD